MKSSHPLFLFVVIVFQACSTAKPLNKEFSGVSQETARKNTLRQSDLLIVHENKMTSDSTRFIQKQMVRSQSLEMTPKQNKLSEALHENVMTNDSSYSKQQETIVTHSKEMTPEQK